MSNPFVERMKKDQVGPYGGLQSSQEDKPREDGKGTWGNRYECEWPECGKRFMSDEASQLHYLSHLLAQIVQAIREREK